MRHMRGAVYAAGFGVAEVFMSGALKSKGIPVILFSALSLLLFLPACNSSIGFGDIIDFVPPELTLNPGGNPRYMNSSTTLSGKVRDNVAVARVICRED